MEKKHYLVSVAGKHGYSFMILCDAKDEDEAINMAADADLFNDQVDADYCVAEEVSENYITRWKKCGGTIQEI